MGTRRAASTHGFTLIELLVVILIIGILVAVSAPSFLGQTQKANDSAAKQYLAVAYREAKAASTDHDGNFTTTGFDAAALAAAIQSGEPQLQVSVASGADADHSCPQVAAGQPHNHVFVDATGTAGDDLVLCADPADTVWTLTVVDGGPPTFSSWKADSTTSSPSPQSLTVTSAGLGSGSVTSTPAGIDCSATCQADFAAGTTVTLAAAPADGSVFSGWSGDCTGSADCVVSLDSSRSVTATFDVAPPPAHYAVFAGSDSLARPQMATDQNSGFSVGAWVRARGFPSGSNVVDLVSTLCDASTTPACSPGKGWALEMNSAGAVALVGYVSGGTLVSSGWSNPSSLSPCAGETGTTNNTQRTLADGHWHYLAGHWDPTDRLRIKFDGKVLNCSATARGVVAWSTAALTLGARPGSSADNAVVDVDSAVLGDGSDSLATPADIVAGGPDSPADLTTTANVVSLWTLDGDGSDTAGGPALTANGSVGYAVDSLGQTYLGLDGDSGYASASQTLSSGSAIFVEGWFRLPSGAPSSTEALVSTLCTSATGCATATGWALEVNSAGAVAFLGYRSGGSLWQTPWSNAGVTTCSTENPSGFTPQSTIADGRWHFVSAHWDNADRARIYIDGLVLGCSSTGSGAIVYSSKPLTVGVNPGASGYFPLQVSGLRLGIGAAPMPSDAIVNGRVGTPNDLTTPAGTSSAWNLNGDGSDAVGGATLSLNGGASFGP